MTPLMVMSLLHQTCLGFEFDFGLTGSKLLLVEIGESTDSPTLCLKCVLLIKTRQRSSAWALLVGKHQQNHNFTYSSLTLGTLNKMKLMLCVLFNYVMGDKIKRLSMSVAFKYIWQKGLSFLTLEGLSTYKSLHDYDYHLSEIRCAKFQIIWF